MCEKKSSLLLASASILLPLLMVSAMPREGDDLGILGTDWEGQVCSWPWSGRRFCSCPPLYVPLGNSVPRSQLSRTFLMEVINYHMEARCMPKRQLNQTCVWVMQCQLGTADGTRTCDLETERCVCSEGYQLTTHPTDGDGLQCTKDGNETATLRVEGTLAYTENGTSPARTEETCLDTMPRACVPLSSLGLCNAFPTEMGRACPLSCGNCSASTEETCVDMMPRACAPLSNLGLCRAFPREMGRVCPLSCGNCG